MLHAGALVELKELVDLTLLLGDRRLVEGELHPVVAVGDHFAHQRRVLRGDVVADELSHVHKAHDPVVVAHPLVHLAQLDIAYDVVQRLEDPLRRTVSLGERGGPLDVAGQVDAVIAGTVHEGVAGVSVCRDGTHSDGAVLVGKVLRLLQDRGPGRARRRDTPVDIRYFEGDVGDTIAVDAVVV